MKDKWQTKCGAALPAELAGKLHGTIRRIRLMQIAKGLLATGAAALASLLALMGIDFALPLAPETARAALLLFFSATVLYTAYVSLAKPLMMRLSPVRMARILETRHPELQERISSSLELSIAGMQRGNISGELTEILMTDAERDLESLSPKSEFKGDAIKKSAIAAAAAFSAMLLLFLAKPDVAAILFRRAVHPLGYQDNAYASKMKVEPGNITVLAGDGIDFILETGKNEDEVAELWIFHDGKKGRISERMNLLPGEDGAGARYALRLNAIDESFFYRMRAGKALTARYRLNAVPAPAHGEVSITVTPPGYTPYAKSHFTTNAPCKIRAAAGSEIRVETSFPRKSKAVLAAGKRTIPAKEGGFSQKAVFSWKAECGKGNDWAILLEDEFGFTNAPATGEYEIIPDLPPDIRLVSPGNGTYALPAYGRLDALYRARDDYAIASARLFIQPDNDAMPWIKDSEITPKENGTWEISEEISVGEFAIGGAKKLRIWLEATDNMPMELGGPNKTKSRIIAIMLDNRENRTIIDQMRVPQRDSITNSLAKAIDNLRLAAETAPGISDAGEKMKFIGEKRKNALLEAQKAKEVADQGIFRPLAAKMEALEENLASSVPVSAEDGEEAKLKSAIEAMVAASQEAERIMESVKRNDRLLEKASNLESLAAKGESEAKRALERQFLPEEMVAWGATQEEIKNKFGAMDEMAPDNADRRISLIEEDKKDGQPRTGDVVSGMLEKAAQNAKEAAEEPVDRRKTALSRAAEQSAKKALRAAGEKMRAMDNYGAIEKSQGRFGEIAKRAENLARAGEDLAYQAAKSKLDIEKEETRRLERLPAKESLAIAKKAEDLYGMLQEAESSRNASMAPKIDAAKDELAMMAGNLSSGPYHEMMAKEAQDLAGNAEKLLSEMSSAVRDNADFPPDGSGALSDAKRNSGRLSTLADDHASDMRKTAGEILSEADNLTESAKSIARELAKEIGDAREDGPEDEKLAALSDAAGAIQEKISLNAARAKLLEASARKDARHPLAGVMQNAMGSMKKIEESMSLAQKSAGNAILDGSKPSDEAKNLAQRAEALAQEAAREAAVRERARDLYSSNPHGHAMDAADNIESAANAISKSLSNAEAYDPEEVSGQMQKAIESASLAMQSANEFSDPIGRMAAAKASDGARALSEAKRLLDSMPSIAPQLKEGTSAAAQRELSKAIAAAERSREIAKDAMLSPSELASKARNRAEAESAELRDIAMMAEQIAGESGSSNGENAPDEAKRLLERTARALGELGEAKSEIPAINQALQTRANKERELSKRSLHETPSAQMASMLGETSRKIDRLDRAARHIERALMAQPSNNAIARAELENAKRLLSPFGDGGKPRTSHGDKSLLPQEETEAEIARSLQDLESNLEKGRDLLANGKPDDALLSGENAAMEAQRLMERSAEIQAAREKAAKALSSSSGKLAVEAMNEAARLEKDAAHAKEAGIGAAAQEIAEAARAVESSPGKAKELAAKALANAMKSQQPSEKQKEAAMAALKASHKLMELAHEAASMAGVDAIISDEASGRENVKKQDREQNGGASGEKEGNPGLGKKNDSPDGVVPEMPEWLRRLGFPLSEWLKYRGKISSGLPDSALEYVPEEYRELVRSYFSVLAKEQ